MSRKPLSVRRQEFRALARREQQAPPPSVSSVEIPAPAADRQVPEAVLPPFDATPWSVDIRDGDETILLDGFWPDVRAAMLERLSATCTANEMASMRAVTEAASPSGWMRVAWARGRMSLIRDGFVMAAAEEKTAAASEDGHEEAPRPLACACA
jgi:hypothetical protein